MTKYFGGLMYHGDASELTPLKGRKPNGDFMTKGSEEYSPLHCKLLAMALLEESDLKGGGEQGDNNGAFTENEPVCLAKLPVWLDEFGSNELLFAPPTQLYDDVNGGAPAAVESTAVSADSRLPGPTER